MKLWTMAGVALYSSVAGMSMSHANDISVLNYYPACDYSVVGEDTAVQHIDIQGQLVQAKEVQPVLPQLIETLKTKAKESGAEALALTIRNVHKRSSGKASVSLTGQFIGACKNHSKLKAKATPLNANGSPQAQMDVAKVSIKYSHTIQLVEKVKNPELGDNLLIDPRGSLYGMALNSSYAEVVERFGTPVFEFTPSADTRILAYGRSHWLWFENNRFTRAASYSDIFNNEFINHLEFDERFDDREWELPGKLHKGEAVTPEQIEQFNRQAASGEADLSLVTEQLLKNNQAFTRTEVVGFDLQNKAYHGPAQWDFSPIKNTALNEFVSLLKQRDTDELLDIRDVTAPTIGQSRKNSGRYLYLFDANTLVETIGSSVAEISVSPDLIKSAGKQWKFDQFYFGQPLQEVLNIAPDNVFHYRDTVELEQNGYFARLFLNDNDGEQTVYAMKISVM